MHQYFAVALVSFIAGFWFAGLDLHGHKKASKVKSKKSQKMGFSFDSEGRPLDD